MFDMLDIESLSQVATNLFEPTGMFDIESLSISLCCTMDNCRVSLVQLTGTRTTNASIEMGTNILSLQQLKGRK
jgi:hypothetical protein